MARVSFGSRAGTNSDYLVGSGQYAHRLPTLNGSYSSVDELTAALKGEIDASAQSAISECTTCELALRLDASLPLLRPVIGPYADGGEHDLPPEFKTSWSKLGGDDGSGPNLPHASVESVLALPTGQVRQIVQRAASRGIIQAVENVDGFKYSFNNAWAAKDEEGLRFSYICQDSMQNKDRHANGYTKTQKHLKSGVERGVRKATYDCKGSVSVKFSYIRKCVDVFYRHYAIHSTVADRKPQPRPPPSGLPNPMALPPSAMQQDDGGLLGTLQAEESAYAEPAPVQRPASPMAAANFRRPLKHRRDSDVAVPINDPAKPMSLVDLLRQSEDARKIPDRTDEAPKPSRRYAEPPVSYDLPAWQMPPKAPSQPPPPPSRPLQQRPSHSQYPNPVQSPYPPLNQIPQPQRQQEAPTAQMTPTQPPRQDHQGLPPHISQGQGLFATLKPVARANYGATLQSHFVHQSGSRARTSCHHCRVAKKKCDEARPMCGNCSRGGKQDCRYESGAISTTPTQQPLTPQSSTQSSTSTMQQYYSAPPSQHSQSQQSATQHSQYSSAPSQMPQHYPNRPSGAPLSQGNARDWDTSYPKR